MNRRFWLPLLVLVAAMAFSVGIAAILGVSAGDLTIVFALSALGAVGVLAAGAVIRNLVGRRSSSISAQSAVGAVLTAAATLATFTMVSATMLGNERDLALILAQLPLAAGAGVAYGIVNGRRVTADLVALASAVQTLEPGMGGALGVSANTTEVEAVAEALRRTTNRLAVATERHQEMEAARRDLVAWASHDLRTPLASLRALAEALADDVASDEQARRRYLDSLTVHVNRLSALVDDLFELAQIEAGSLSLNLEQTHVPTLVAEVVDSFTPGARAAAVDLELVVASEVGMVPASRDHIGRVLANLLHNAIRHTPPGGHIRVEVDADGDGSTLVAVTDECGGIPPQDVAHVFDRLWRGDQARSSEGAGLGLTIAKGLIQAHGGTIDVANADQGCRIRFYLTQGGR